VLLEQDEPTRSESPHAALQHVDPVATKGSTKRPTTASKTPSSDADDLPGGSDELRQQEGHVAGATSHVEHAHA
jgi:hypothetical protein